MGPDNNSLYSSSHNLNGCGRDGVVAPRIRPHSAPLPSRQQLPRHARLSSHAHETSFIATAITMSQTQAWQPKSNSIATRPQRV